MTSSNQFFSQQVDPRRQDVESIRIPLSYLYIQPTDVITSRPAYFQPPMLLHQQSLFMPQQYGIPVDFVLPQQNEQQTDLRAMQDPHQSYVTGSLQGYAHPVEVHPPSSAHFQSIDLQYGQPAGFSSTVPIDINSYSLHDQKSHMGSVASSSHCCTSDEASRPSSSNCSFPDDVSTNDSVSPLPKLFATNVGITDLPKTSQKSLTAASNKTNRVILIVDPDTQEVVNRDMLDVYPVRKLTSAAVERTDQEGVLNWLLWLTKIRTFRTEFIQIIDASKDTNLSKLIYCKKFLYFMRKVVKELRHADCPITDDELKEIGVFRTNMPPSFTRRGNSNSRRAVVSPASRRQTGVKRHENIDFGFHMKQQQMKILNDKSPESDSQPKLRKSINAWRPSRRVELVDDVEVERLKYEKLKREVRGLLNKITPSTYEILAEKFIAKKCYEDKKFMDIVIDLIFDKAVEEPNFCSLYSDLCKRQVDAEGAEKQTLFFRGIIMKCQDTFTSSKNSNKEVTDLEKQINSETLNDTQRSELKQKVESLRNKEKRRLNGIIRFIAEMHRHNLLVNSIINWCVVELILQFDQTGDDIYVEYAVKMIESVGKSFEQQKSKQAEIEKEPVELVFSHLSTIRTKLSSRVRFMIMDLEDLRENKWVPRHGNTNPKKIEDVHKEIAKEQQIDQKERDVYLARAHGLKEVGGRKYNDRIYRSNGGSRNFNRRCNDVPLTIRRSEAALKSIQASCSPPKKDLNLKQFENQRLGVSRNRKSSLFVQSTIYRASNNARKLPLPLTYENY